MFQMLSYRLRSYLYQVILINDHLGQGHLFFIFNVATNEQTTSGFADRTSFVTDRYTFLLVDEE